MTVTTSNMISCIFRRHTARLRTFGADTELARYAMLAAMDELAEAVKQDDAGDQLARIERVLESHDPALYDDVANDRTDLATAIDAALTTERNAFAALTSDLRNCQAVAASQRKEISALTVERDEVSAELFALRQQFAAIEEWLENADSARYAAICTGEITLAQAIAAHHLDIRHDAARLTAELTTLRSYVTAPKPSDYPTPILTAEEVEAQTAPGKTLPAPVLLRQATLSPAANDYWIGLDANRWSWRGVPKSLRLEMVRFVISTTPNHSQSEFDAARPAWMATASSHVQTFGVPWSQLSDLTREIEVAA